MTSTDELGHQITRCIADAVSDVLAHVASYCGEQMKVTHQCPPEGGGGLMPCCSLTPFEASRTDRITEDPALVTCTGKPTASEPEPEHDIRWLTGRVRQLENALGEAAGRFAFPPDVTLEARATAGVQQLGYWKMILRGEPEPAPSEPKLHAGESPITRMWRDLVTDVGIDQANRQWPALDPRRGGPGYTRKP